ncbi:lipid phosphate phosphatase epsilon 2, chloroplastic isoform X3 [Arabidopsis lyrata subsp. lyrata]|uniref:lipid phosphate phosphatase epsilon 2, chloroplastic isoform X3 n=1 Tax=Arabidopsis lyrata subsp. lyrata TaxID=81972 RepID=UPI000A29E333|nr:lipid phosphate phosphatase epsilon 2, chloroplastic isoform X3 [Arabidopsis lyrata subsp. lyrata]|eukprot:XP_020890757.1 lipid phosphate phosphatase epsilon 2, chloroplastic isoform X3 [Arabidopsis lyrata subsp. lyrata]
MAASSSLLLLHRHTCNFYSAASSVPARFRISSPLDRRRRRRIWSASGSTKSMADLVNTNARRDGEEQFQALEQEAFINNSSSDAGGGIEAIANRLSKWIVAALFGSVLLLRHDGAALWAVIGSVSNSALSVALKRLLNQERPVATLRSDPGMPSSHAQSISFISVFSVFSVMEWLGTNVLSLLLSGLILALGSYFTWLRVSQKLHTTSQVVVGAIVGSVYSTLWHFDHAF